MFRVSLSSSGITSEVHGPTSGRSSESLLACGGLRSLSGNCETNEIHVISPYLCDLCQPLLISRRERMAILMALQYTKSCASVVLYSYGMEWESSLPLKREEEVNIFAWCHPKHKKAAIFTVLWLQRRAGIKAIQKKFIFFPSRELCLGSLKIKLPESYLQ